MAYELSWYIPERVILLQIIGEQSLGEIKEMIHATQTMISEGAAPMYVLLDDTRGGRPPVSIRQLKAQMPLGDLQSLGWVIAIGETNPIANIIVPLLMKVVRINFVRYPSLEAALDFLEKQDISLAQLSQS